jgi:hypothetical protein
MQISITWQYIALSSCDSQPPSCHLIWHNRLFSTLLYRSTPTGPLSMSQLAFLQAELARTTKLPARSDALLLLVKAVVIYYRRGNKTDGVWEKKLNRAGAKRRQGRDRARAIEGKGRRSGSIRVCFSWLTVRRSCIENICLCWQSASHRRLDMLQTTSPAFRSGLLSSSQVLSAQLYTPVQDTLRDTDCFQLIIHRSLSSDGRLRLPPGLASPSRPYPCSIRSDPILLLCCPPRFSGILSPSSQPASLSFQRSVLLTRLSERSIASPLLYESPKPWTFSELLRFSYLLFVAECLLFSLNPRQISLCSGLIADFLDVLFSTWKSISSGWTNLERIPYRRCCVRVPLKEEADAKIMPWEMEKPSRGFRPAGESGGGGVLLGWTAGRSVLVLPACFRAYRR